MATNGYTPDPYTQYSTESLRNPTTPLRTRAQLPPPSPASAGMVYLTTTGSKTAPIDRFIPVQDAYNMLPSLGPDAMAQFNETMDKYYGKGRWDTSWKSGLWNKAVGAASYALTYGGKRISPLEALDGVLANETSGSGGAGGKAAAYKGPVTTKSTTESVNLTNPTEARTLVNNSLTQYLGREATKQEQDSFLAALNAQEKMNPTVTNQTSTTTPQGKAMNKVESEVQSQGGFNPSTFAQEYAQGQEGSAEFQAASSLLDTFIGSLKARV